MKNLYFCMTFLVIAPLIVQTIVAMESDRDSLSKFEKLEDCLADIIKDIKSDRENEIVVSADRYKDCLVMDLTVSRCLRHGTSACWDGTTVALSYYAIHTVEQKTLQYQFAMYSKRFPRWWMKQEDNFDDGSSD